MLKKSLVLFLVGLVTGASAFYGYQHLKIDDYGKAKLDNWFEKSIVKE